MARTIRFSGRPGRAPLGLLLLLGASALGGKPHAALRVKAPSDPDERPRPVEVSATRQAGSYALVITFHKAPDGDACGTLCANATLFIDTDNNRATGLQLGKEAAETGADLAIALQGTRDYQRTPPTPLFKVKLRRYDKTSPAEGEPVLDLDTSRTPEAVQVAGNSALVMLDLGDVEVPRGSKVRLVYHPSGEPAVQGLAPAIPPRNIIRTPGAHPVRRRGRG